MTGARTPEELETMLEDALLVRDRAAVARLFEEDAVLRAARGEARGADQIGRLTARMWHDCGYLADPRLVVQARDTALVVGRRGINVVRRTGGWWRYAISLPDAHSIEGGTR